MSSLLKALKSDYFDVEKMIDTLYRRAMVANAEEFVRVKKERDDGIYFSPSSLGKCLREVYYSMVSAFEIPTLEQVDPKFARICATGHDMHARYQQLMYHARRLAGGYTCRACGAQSEDGEFSRCPSVCPHCGGDKALLKYREIRKNDHTNRIRFKPDGLIVRNRKSDKLRLYYCDFKSINTYKLKYMIKDSTTPRENAQQLNFYMCHMPVVWFEDRWVRTEPEGYLLYEDKNTQELVSRKVVRDWEMYEADMENIAYVNRCVERRKLPKAVADAKTCKWCNFKDACEKAST